MLAHNDVYMDFSDFDKDIISVNKKMKKIINRKMYNTETAEEIATNSNNVPRNNFRWFDETLYRKKTGEFFLYGEGGALSAYATVLGPKSWCEGEGIIPLTLEEAMDWCEKHLDPDYFEELFGEVDE